VIRFTYLADPEVERQDQLVPLVQLVQPDLQEPVNFTINQLCRAQIQLQSEPDGWTATPE
jgi:hypothetical protein